MKFPYMVIHNGVFYSAGMEVPIEEEHIDKEPSNEIIEDKATPIEEVAETPIDEKPRYSRNKIGRMTRDEIEPLAKEVGVRNTEAKTSLELKKAVIEKLGL